jgi:hypothetical protein
MQLRFAMMFSVTSLAGAFSGLLAFGIQHLNGKHGIAGWQWIFIVVRRYPSLSVVFTNARLLRLGGCLHRRLWARNFLLRPRLAHEHQTSHRRGAEGVLPRPCK